MKPFVYFLLLFATISVRGISQTFRGDPKFKGGENFIKTFPNAMILNSETKGEVTKLSFTWKGDSLEAYYDLSGTLVATTHQIRWRTLPISVQMK